MSHRVYLPYNVMEAALNRMRWLFDEFENVLVSYSGGKDSTVVYNLALQVAREKGRLPLQVFFLDQEAEWEATIDQVKSIMYNPDVKPYWLQVPIKLFNATSVTEHWLQCWAPEDEDRWMRPHDPIAMTQNVYGTDRFHEFFRAFVRYHWPHTRTAQLTGVRAEESPNRRFGLTSYKTYKWVTWGSVIDKEQDHYTFHPLYDWSYMDIWKAIHENGWSYNAIYDFMYRYGVPVRNMRVSNVHHETAVHSLFMLQEIEPQTYARLTQRIAGIDMAGKLGKDDYFVRQLPYMFASWREYRDFLLDKLITEPTWKENFKRYFNRDELYFYPVAGESLIRAHVNSILTNDWEGVKIENMRAAINTEQYRVMGRDKWNAFKRERREMEKRGERPPLTLLTPAS